MGVNTSRVPGRRRLQFETFQDVLAEAERLSCGDVRTLGNWTKGQIFQHLAESMHASVDGFPARASLPSRLAIHVTGRRRFLVGPMPPGTKLTGKSAAALAPGPTSPEEGLAALRRAVYRLRAETDRAEHPLLGRLTADEWEQFHLRHAELHMSFLLPMIDTVGSAQATGYRDRQVDGSLAS